MRFGAGERGHDQQYDEPLDLFDTLDFRVGEDGMMDGQVCVRPQRREREGRSHELKCGCCIYTKQVPVWMAEEGQSSIALGDGI